MTSWCMLALKFALDYNNAEFRHLRYCMDLVKSRSSNLGNWEEILKHKLHQFLQYLLDQKHGTWKSDNKMSINMIEEA